MKMTAHIPNQNLKSSPITEALKKRIDQIISTKWKLKSITETGIVSDEANFKDVEIVFSHYHIYALYGNRVDKFKYRFLSAKTFEVMIENQPVKCRIKTLTKDEMIFHADFKNAHFILELSI